MSFVSTALAAFSPDARTTSPVGANAIVSSATPPFRLGEQGLDGLGRRADLVGALRALALEVGQELAVGGPQLLGMPLEGGPLLRLRVVDLAVGPAALGLLVERLERPATGVLVDVGDDEQGEVEDPLEVAGADVEEDARGGTACP